MLILEISCLEIRKSKFVLFYFLISIFYIPRPTNAINVRAGEFLISKKQNNEF